MPYLMKKIVLCVSMACLALGGAVSVSARPASHPQVVSKAKAKPAAKRGVKKAQPAAVKKGNDRVKVKSADRQEKKVRGKKGKKAKAVQPAKPQIYLCTPIPAFKSTWNINDSIIQNNIIPIQQEVAREYGLQVIDLHTLFADGQDMVQPDGIHPNEKGVKRMAEIIAEKLLAP